MQGSMKIVHEAQAESSTKREKKIAALYNQLEQLHEERKAAAESYKLQITVVQRQLSQLCEDVAQGKLSFFEPEENG